MYNMNLEISNYGAIKEANINLKKLNVIVGENGSGKSTSSKLLSCFIIASSKEGEFLANSSIGNRFNSLILNFHEELSNIDLNNENLNKLLLMLDNIPNFNDKFFNKYISQKINVLYDIIENTPLKRKGHCLESFNHFKGLFDVHKDEHHRYFNISNILLNSEFNFFELKLPENFKVHFYGKNDNCDFSHEMLFNQNRLGAEITEGYLNCLNLEEVIYIDSPSIFENNDYQNPIRLENLPYHLRYLSRLLTHRKTIDVYDSEDNSNLINISNLIKKIMGGFIYFDDKKMNSCLKKMIIFIL